MDFSQALRASVKAYFNGQQPEQLFKAQGSGKKAKYTKKYFDKMGKSFGIEPYVDQEDQDAAE